MSHPEKSSSRDSDEAPCKCLQSWAMISPTHSGHCCFLPALQTCHATEVAAWESRLREFNVRGERLGVTDVYETPYNREVLVTVLIYHQRKDIEGCYCGWAEPGKSHAEHVAAIYEESVTARLGAIQ